MLKVKMLVALVLASSTLIGCTEPTPVKVVDAVCTFSSTHTSAMHYSDNSATGYFMDFSGNKMSAYAWAQFVTDNVSDATCAPVK